MKSILTGAMIALFATTAYADRASTAIVSDVMKEVIIKKPYQVEVCTDVQVSGDKTKDTIVGAVIGSVIGHQIDHEAGAKIGAIMGGAIGHDKSDATGGMKRVCQIETRYEEETKRVYSHSIVTFWHEGKQYQQSFKK
jgi:uncharacterized protein YcfJ